MLQFEPAVAGIPEGRFAAMIRPAAGGGWRKLFVGEAASQEEGPHRNGGAEGFVWFAGDEAAELEFRFPAAVKTARFRPSLRQTVPVTVSGNMLRLTLQPSRYGVLEINHDLPESAEAPAYTVYLFADFPQPEPEPLPPETELLLQPGFHPQRQLAAPGIRRIRFAPGLHEIEEQEVRLRSGVDLHLDRGAVIRAGLRGENASDVTVSGQGIFDGTTVIRPAGVNHLSDDGRPGFFSFLFGSDLTIDGVMIYNPHFWNIVPVGIDRFTLRNHKALSWIVNNDGLQPRSCSDLLAEHCFFKCNDDGIAIKTRRKIGRHSRNLIFRDLVIWNDRAGNGVEIGHSSQGDLLETVRFERIDLLHGNPHAALDICIVDHSLVRDVLYDDICAEGRPFGFDFSFAVPSYLVFASDAERGRIRGVTVRNFRSAGEPGRCRIAGNDATHPVEEVRFESLVYRCGSPAGEWKIRSTDELKMELRFARDITLR